MPGRGNRLAGKVALVTGASLGIGRGCAIALAVDGADVVVNYNSSAAAAAVVVREIESLGRRAFAWQANVADRARVAAMIDETVARFGRIDVVVSNAYQSVREPFLDISPEGLQRTLDVSMFGAFHVCQLGAREMVKRGDGGKIVVVSSVHAEHPFGGSTAYNMAKSAIDAMALTMASELAPHRINVNVLHPGWIDTPGERRYATEEQLREEGKRIPWGRLGTPLEMGRCVAFLASDDAEYVTGAILRADGAHILGLS
jgi:glucose 1-dehydrogenase